MLPCRKDSGAPVKLERQNKSIGFGDQSIPSEGRMWIWWLVGILLVVLLVVMIARLVKK